MRVDIFEARGFDSNIYLVEDSGEYALIDTGTGVYSGYHIPEILNIIKKRENLKYIILTHTHPDHAGGISIFNREFSDAMIYVHENEIDFVRDGKIRDLFGMLSGRVPAPVECNSLRDDDVVVLGKAELRIIYTPGHTEGSICLYNRDEKILFSGDTVFPEGSFGRTDLPGGNPEKLVTSLKRLTELEVIQLYPGHMNAVCSGADKMIELSYRQAKTMFGL